ncbi:hypothetical protein [Leptospira noguchii]|uniref:hypothetical protein n=1 Tax=Leptospira noguchii TaxID=28182 RepID=UPI00077395C3|nr:hypothetical protein [Leptospira noguchii]
MSEVNMQERVAGNVENNDPLPLNDVDGSEEIFSHEENQKPTLEESVEEVEGFLQPIVDGLSNLKKSELYDSILQILSTTNRSVKSKVSGVIDLFASKGIESERFTTEQWSEVAEKILKSVNTDTYDRLTSAIDGIHRQSTDVKTKLSLWSSAIDSFLAELAD